MGLLTADIKDTPLDQEFTPEQIAKADAIITRFKGVPGALIPCLHQVQEAVGYLPFGMQRRIAKGLNLSASEILGVVTFYAFFTIKPRGRWLVRVCLGTACYVKGANKLLAKIEAGLGIKDGEMSSDRRYSLEVVRCLGACGKAPALMVNQETHGLVEPDAVMGALDKYK